MKEPVAGLSEVGHLDEGHIVLEVVVAVGGVEGTVVIG